MSEETEKKKRQAENMKWRKRIFSDEYEDIFSKFYKLYRKDEEPTKKELGRQKSIEIFNKICNIIKQEENPYYVLVALEFNLIFYIKKHYKES